jgi:hypothetical protein
VGKRSRPGNRIGDECRFKARPRVDPQGAAPRQCANAGAYARAYMAEHPDASSQAIAVRIDLSHLGQTSMAPSRLNEAGLLKRAGSQGTPTHGRSRPYGEQVARILGYC